MTRRIVAISLAVVALIGVIGYALHAKTASAAAPGTIALAGDVRVDEAVVRAPAITYPTPDYAVGIPTTASASPKKRAAAPTSTSRLPVVSGFLASVRVAQGDHVTKGQVVAVLDTAMLDLGVQTAERARDRAAANVDVIDNNLDKLASTRSTLVKTRATLVKTRASLAATIGVLAKTQSSLEASIAVIQRLVDMPGGPPPNNPPFPVILAQMKAGLAQLTKGLVGAKAGLAQLDAGLKKLDSGLAKLDTGRAQLKRVRKLAVVNLDIAKVAVDAAKASRAQAEIVAPTDGVVTYARPSGTAVMVGAPVVRIRPDGPSHIYAYVTADQLEQISVGSAATVTFDSAGGATLAGKVTYLGDHAEVPPTNYPTAIVHMTRAVRVTIELDDGQTAPPGTPVDVVITTGR